ncbi:HlyD family secretion protein [Pseudaestuariivita atlantica]|uniref:Hemolysin secretion protein D n=1 Tax=Pseudaestuariivita atlantica TaxID=1317121 RepID=A0A0L1JS69_9RHOB|nr:HlyD family efflux transporter periplasmic adaptor subunit [Pseudaestuariivita atlantica]KNG94595.1 hemolysin secretion protein D [Pseudaestuariivita atlantica]
MLCSIAFIAAFLSFCEADQPLAVGYIEGEYVLVAPIETARVERLAIERGQRVEAGMLLAELDDRDLNILSAQAQASVARARAELSDLSQGARDAEIAVAEAAVQSALADFEEAERELVRVQGLFVRNVSTQAQLDQAASKRDIAQARLSESEARLQVLRLPARQDRIAAAEAAVAEATGTLDLMEWRLSQRRLQAEVAGTVADIYRFPGDLAGPQAPVLSILPDTGIKLRFYVPESAYALLKVGDSVAFACDNCPDGLKATVSYLATSPEFTPPVIYSLDTRQKLVYLAEALIAGSDTDLKPGQIIDVRLPEASR